MDHSLNAVCIYLTQWVHGCTSSSPCMQTSKIPKSFYAQENTIIVKSASPPWKVCICPCLLREPQCMCFFFFFYFSLLHVDLQCPHMTQKSMQFRETREVSTGWRPGCPWQLEPAPPTATTSPPQEGPSSTRSLFVETHSPALHPALLSFLPQLHPRWKSTSPLICCTRRGNGALVPAKPRLSHSISGCQSPFLIDWHCQNQERIETNWFILGVGRLAFYSQSYK